MSMFTNQSRSLKKGGQGLAEVRFYLSLIVAEQAQLRFCKLWPGTNKSSCFQFEVVFIFRPYLYSGLLHILDIEITCRSFKPSNKIR